MHIYCKCPECFRWTIVEYPHIRGPKYHILPDGTQHEFEMDEVTTISEHLPPVFAMKLGIKEKNL